MPQICCPGAQKCGTQHRHLNCPVGRQECSPGSGKCHHKGWKSGNSFQQIHCTTKQCKGTSEPPHPIEFLFSHSSQNSHLSPPPGLSPELRQSCSSLQTLGSVSFLHGHLPGITTASPNNSTQGTLEHSKEGAAHIPDFISRGCFTETPQFV